MLRFALSIQFSSINTIVHCKIKDSANVREIVVDCVQVQNSVVQSSFNEFLCRITRDCFTNGNPYTHVEMKVIKTQNRGMGKFPCHIHPPIAKMDTQSPEPLRQWYTMLWGSNM
jgi:hypothetical protein